MGGRSRVMGPVATLLLSCVALVIAISLSNPKLLTEEVQIGIDLGTTFSVVATCKRGNVTVMPVDGHNTVPSIVSAQQDGSLLVGRAAAARRLTHSADTVYHVKRIIGRRLNDATVQEETKLFPFKVSEREGTPFAYPQHKKRGPVLSIDLPSARQPWTPQEISAAVLRKLKNSAEKAQGWRTKIGFTFSQVTVSVPVEFSYRQRDATKKAAELAGFTQVRLVEEPIAAAMAYGLEKKSERYVLVYDLGGGTLDVAVLHLEDGAFRVAGTAGDPHLGGADFDESIVNLLLQKLSALTDKNVTADAEAMQKLYTSAESAKRQLSMLHPSSKCTLEPEYAAYKVDVELPFGFSTSVSLLEYNQINQHLFKRASKPITAVLSNNGFNITEMNEIVLVGGSTRMPQIQTLLKEYFQRDHVYTSIDPDEAIAVGAAAGFGCRNKK